MYKSVVEGKGGITAKVVADSIANGVRLTTLELRYPRFIHSEFMTHRQFSRNASSSRAIPVKKMIEQVENDPAMPIHWGKNQAGMQAREEHSHDVDPWGLGTKYVSPRRAWRIASEEAILVAEGFAEAGYHKQIVNRLLEPFQFISAVVTATEWDNFFKLRLHEDAQPEIYELARVMADAMRSSKPELMNSAGYHLPYVDLYDFISWDKGRTNKTIDYAAAIKASVARCARVSYLNHDNSEPNIEKDIELHDKLLEAGHMSPFEHCLTPMPRDVSVGGIDTMQWFAGMTHITEDGTRWSSNMREWIMYRNLL